MRFPVLAIFLSVFSYINHSCYGQHATKQLYKASIETKYISTYDTFFPPINLEFFNKTEGLPEGEISEVTQTNDGFLWISIWNYGLVRYDGYNFRSFVPAQGDSIMPACFISKIVKSKRNGLWLRTEKGLVWFDLKTYKSKIIPNLPKQFLTFHWSCAEDGLGELWIFGNGLFHYNLKTQNFEKISRGCSGIYNNGDSISISEFFLAEPTLSPDGSIWLTGPLLMNINPRTKQAVCYPCACREVLLDPDGSNVWVTDLHGLSRYNFKNNSWLNIKFKQSEDESELYNNRISHIENDRLWMINGNTIRIMNIRNFQTQLYKSDMFGSQSYTSMTEGLNSTRWVYTSHELFCNFSETKRFTYQKILPESERVLSYWKDEKNNIEWFGTTALNNTGRLYRYDLKNNTVSGFDMPVQPCSPFVLSKISDHELLIGVGGMIKQPGKLFYFDMRNLSFKAISKKISNRPGITTDSFEYLGVCRDKHDNLWLSVYRDGLLEYETSSDKFYLVIQNSVDTANTDHVSLRAGNSFFVDSDGFIWLGGESGTLKKIDSKTEKIEEIKILKDDRIVTALSEDLDGHVCLGVDTGMALYSNASKRLVTLPGIPLCVTTLFDSNNNIIGLANDGLWFYDIKLKMARKFNSKDGLRQVYSDYISNTLNQSGKNEILISDFYRFPFSYLCPKKEVPPLHITNIKIFGKEITTANNVDALDALVLNHTQNQLSFEFAAASFLPHDANSYACMLQGLDTNWQQLGSNNSINYTNLFPGKYTFKLKTTNRDGVWGRERILHIVIIPAVWQTLWFKILAVLFVLSATGGFLYWLYRNRLHKLNLKYQLEQEKLTQQKREAEFEKRLADLTLSALRSQINPHFIFNCLNSIKLYATQNDINAATDYLTKFSRLIRQVLENSRSDKISLASELEVLRLYIEMEAMRFKEKLKYSISVEPNVEADYIEIPPLLLQPYVENAIWHGLMPKEKGGHLDIVAAMKDDSILIITIKDDGIGRAKSAELKSKIATQHKSFGMKITSERMALINQMHNTVSTVTIDDLADNKGEAAGTLVTIQITV